MIQLSVLIATHLLKVDKAPVEVPPAEIQPAKPAELPESASNPAETEQVPAQFDEDVAAYEERQRTREWNWRKDIMA